MRRPYRTAFFLALWPLPAFAAEPVHFNRDVRPILSEHCYQCHGPDKGHRKADLRLDRREDAMENGVLSPGKVEESELVQRIFSNSPSKMMPPPKANKPLSQKQKEVLKAWIAEGAVYEPHWAYIPPQRPAVPPTKDWSWVKTPIDAFLLRELELRGIRPSPPAEPWRLVRRLYLDLLGLPPAPEEVDAFVNDPDPRAYEKLVDRLLESPHYGERMAVPWLDLVRYADTVGYHGDQNQNIFPYRDYVIDALNRNKPFDQFTREQLAGDLLPQPTTEQMVATGFNRLNMMTREGGAQPKEYLAKYSADRVRTVSMAWLGSTMGCAECHDHKYDPFTMKDFYSLAAFFADIRQWGVYQDYPYTPNPDLKGWSNDHPFPPEIEVENTHLKKKQKRLRDEIGQLLADSARGLAEPAQLAAFHTWCAETASYLKQNPSGWQTPPLAGDPPPETEPQADGSFLIRSKPKKGDAHVFDLKPPPGWLAALRVEVLPHAEHKGTIARGGAASAAIRIAATYRGKPVSFFLADAERQDPRYFNGEVVIGVRDGWKTSTLHARELQSAVWLLDQPLRLDGTSQLAVQVRSDNIGCVRISLSPFAEIDPRHLEPRAALVQALIAAEAVRTSEHRRLLAGAYLLSTGWDLTHWKRFKQLARQLQECRGGKAFSMVTIAGRPLPVRVLPRGNFLDESGPEVSPALPNFLAGHGSSERRLGRLDLANWLVAADNPLTPRVFVNRLWKMFFGVGISGVMEDVGAQGEWPTHPELLDWLAVEFRDSGWNVKHMVRLMVLSAAYRQDSRARPDLKEVDPGNRLLAHQSPRRLEAEFVRDQALAIAGLLNPDVGGPSARPYQPAGYYENLQFPDRDYIPHDDERQYRRGIYTHWQRTFLHPMLANFDAPPREECTASRPVANTPQQALTLLNDPTFVEAARVLAEKSLRSCNGADTDRLVWLYRRVLARPPKGPEAEGLLRLLEDQRRRHASTPEEARKLLRIGLAPVPKDLPATELASWTEVCRVLLNLQETITRY